MESFEHLSHLLRDESAAAHRAASRLAAQADVAMTLDVERLRKCADDIGDAAALLGELAPHERLVHAWLSVGTLVEFPTFTRNTAHLRTGDLVLVRARLEQVFARASEARIEFAAGGLSAKFEVLRADIVGVERPPPSLWRPRGQPSR